MVRITGNNVGHNSILVAVGPQLSPSPRASDPNGVIQVLMLVLTISSLLVAIGDINHPFQDSLHVYPTSFERARDTLADLP